MRKLLNLRCSRKPWRNVYEASEVMESEVENETSMGDTDVSVP